MKTVTKRDGTIKPFELSKIEDRLLRLCTRPSRFGLQPLDQINIQLVLEKLLQQGCDEIPTQSLDDLCCEIAASLNTVHFEYSTLAARLLVSNIHKQTNFGVFSQRMRVLHELGTLSNEFFAKVLRFQAQLDDAVDYFLDFDISFFGMKTLLKSYLLRGDVECEVPRTKMCRKRCKKRLMYDQSTEDSESHRGDSHRIFQESPLNSLGTKYNSQPGGSHYIESQVHSTVDNSEPVESSFNAPDGSQSMPLVRPDESEAESCEILKVKESSVVQRTSNYACEDNSQGSYNEEDDSSCDMHDFEPSHTLQSPVVFAYKKYSANSEDSEGISSCADTTETLTPRDPRINKRKFMENAIIERPQDLFMRVAVGIHDDIGSILHTYQMLSKKLFTHATPTLFNAGTVKPQMSSCFLLDMQSDSIDGIYGTLKQCAFISKNSGGIGLSITKIRSTGSRISFSGSSNGIIPMLRVYDATARYVDQGGNKRPGTIATYIEPWHADIYDFIELRKNTGKDERRCRDLFLGLWIPDLFMKRVQDNLDWSLFCPNDCYFLVPKDFICLDSENLATTLLDFMKINDSIQVSNLQKITAQDRAERGAADSKNNTGLPISQDTSSVVPNTAPECTHPLGGSSKTSKNPNHVSFETNCPEIRESQNTETQSPESCFETFNGGTDSFSESTDHMRNATIAVIDFLENTMGKLSAFEQRSIVPRLFDSLKKSGSKNHPTLNEYSNENIDPSQQAQLKNKIGENLARQNTNSAEAFRKYDHVVTGKCDPLQTLSKFGSVFDNLFDCLKSAVLKNDTTNKRRKSVDPHLPRDTNIPQSSYFYVLKDNKITKYERLALYELHSEEFERAYEALEAKHLARKTIKAQHLWKAIIEAQIETGTPYMLYKDSCNKRNNQKNLGTLKSSNLCTEILQYTSYDEIAVCNLGSIALPRFVKVYGTQDSQNTRIANQSAEIPHPHLNSVNSLCSATVQPNKNNRPDSKDSGDSSSISSHIYDPYCVNGLLSENNDHSATKAVNNFFRMDDLSASEFNDIYSAININHDPNNLYEDTSNKKLYFDFKSLILTSEKLAYNLNCVIDKNYYPLYEAESSNQKHRPIGIGVQGLADTFFMLNLPFECEKAQILNKKIFECIYYGAMRASIRQAMEKGPYPSFHGSPLSQGILQFDYFHEKIEEIKSISNRHSSDNFNMRNNTRGKLETVDSSESAIYQNYPKYRELDAFCQTANITDKDLDLNWAGLRLALQKYGARNSLLIAPMPTASTSQILGYNECIEPNTSNIYTRRTLAGEFQVVNKYLMDDLLRLKRWDINMKNYLVENEGSIQRLDLPPLLKEKYKNVWDMKMKNIIKMAADRQMFIDQSQSLNLFVAEPTYSKLSSMHFYAWKCGLKTGMYYLRTKPTTTAIKFTVDKEALKAVAEIEQEEGAVCSMEDGCLSCSG